MCIELVYHLWSPEYRRGYDIEDPLYLARLDVDADEGREYEERWRELKPELKPEILTKIEKVCRAHREGTGFTWPFSTHKNLHGAAVNGILAGDDLFQFPLSRQPLSGNGTNSIFRRFWSDR